MAQRECGWGACKAAPVEAAPVEATPIWVPAAGCNGECRVLGERYGERSAPTGARLLARGQWRRGDRRERARACMRSRDRDVRDREH